MQNPAEHDHVSDTLGQGDWSPDFGSSSSRTDFNEALRTGGTKRWVSIRLSVIWTGAGYDLQAATPLHM
jgi:hypothetical protein